MSNTMKTKTSKIALYFILITYTVCVTYPLIWVVLGSFKSTEELFLNPWGLPSSLDLSVFNKVLFEYEMSTNFINSIQLSVGTVIITCVVSVMAAYAISRMKWKLNKFILGFFLLGIMIPVHSTLIPLFIDLQDAISLFGAKATLMIPYIAFSLPVSIFILCGYMESLPRELEEAAIIDGSSILGSFIRIIVPLTKPAIATIIIFNFLTVWNELLFGMVFLSRNMDQTIPVGLMKFTGTFASQWNEVLAGISTAIIPSIILFMMLQKKIISGLTAGSVKG